MGIISGIKERRAHYTGAGSLQSPPSWFQRLFGGEDPIAGVRVTEISAMGLSAYWACLNVLAQDVAKLPIKVYRPLDTKGKEQLPKHIARRLLNGSPNPEMTSYSFRESIISHAAGWGNGYAEIERDGAGRPLHLWLQRPDRTTVFRKEDGSIWYTFSSDRYGPATVPAADVFHVHGLAHDGLIGHSVAWVARQSLSLSMASERFGAAFFGNSAVPSLVFTHPGKIKDGGVKLKESWNEKHQGSARSRGLAVLEEGIKIEKIGIDPTDSQFLETRQFQIPEVCRWFRMSPTKVGDYSRATWSNIEQLAISHVTDTLMSWFVRFEQEAGRRLLSPSEQERGVTIEHLVAGLLRGDLLSRYRAYMIGRQGGWLSANDVLDFENANPIENGDVYLSPTNMIPADKLDLVDPSPSGGGVGGDMGGESKPATQNSAVLPLAPARSARANVEGIARAFRPVLADVLRRAVRTETDMARRWAKRGAPPAWASEFVNERRAAIETSLAAPMLALFSLVPSAAGNSEGLVGGLSARHCQRTARDLAAATTESLPLMLDGWENSRTDADVDAELRWLVDQLCPTAPPTRN